MPFQQIRRWFHTVAIRRRLFTLLRDVEVVRDDDYNGLFKLMKRTNDLLKEIVIIDVFTDLSGHTIHVKTNTVEDTYKILEMYPEISRALILDSSTKVKVLKWLMIDDASPSSINSALSKLSALLDGAVVRTGDSGTACGRMLRSAHDDVITLLHLISETTNIRRRQ